MARRKPRRTYMPRIVGGQIMMPADLERLYKYMLDIEHIDQISDQMRAVVAPRKRPPSQCLICRKAEHRKQR